MPMMGGLAVHDDSKHTGNAKRATANGVAGLNSVSEILELDVMTQKYLSIGMVM